MNAQREQLFSQHSKEESIGEKGKSQELEALVALNRCFFPDPGTGSRLAGCKRRHREAAAVVSRIQTSTREPVNETHLIHAFRIEEMMTLMWYLAR